jgi:hypothetical protein
VRPSSQEHAQQLDRQCVDQRDHAVGRTVCPHLADPLARLEVDDLGRQPHVVT